MDTQTTPEQDEAAQEVANYARELLTQVYRNGVVADDTARALRYSFAAIALGYTFMLFAIMGGL